MSALVPLLFLFIIAYALIKKVDVYNSFLRGIEDAGKFTLSMLPYFIAVYMACNLFEVCGLYKFLTDLLTPATEFLGVPKVLIKLILIKPFSGSGSLAYVKEIVAQFGADAYVSRCACIIYTCSETVFYMSAVYFAKVKNKKIISCLIAVLVANVLTVILACLVCRVL